MNNEFLFIGGPWDGDRREVHHGRETIEVRTPIKNKSLDDGIERVLANMPLHDRHTYTVRRFPVGTMNKGNIISFYALIQLSDMEALLELMQGYKP